MTQQNYYRKNKCVALAAVLLVASSRDAGAFMNSKPFSVSRNANGNAECSTSSTPQQMVGTLKQDTAPTTNGVSFSAMKQTVKSVSSGSVGSPVVVSAKAEALSHSDTTMKLTPSFELFQLLDAEEGGTTPDRTGGNALRDEHALKAGRPDTLDGFLLVYGDKEKDTKKKIESLPDPFKIVEKELKPFSDSISELVSSDQPILSMAAKHFFEKRHGKRFRPTIVQLMAQACAAAEPEGSNASEIGELSSWEQSGASTVNIEGGTVTVSNHKGSDVWRRQAQLGQIVEMIHVASLIHDDVLDEADTRRGGESVHKLYSNKVAVLAGDYLLARASVLLARLENTAVVQIMATALESLVAGEIMQLKAAPESLLQMESYLKKSYYKTASLICYACRSTALLGGHVYGSNVATACEEFGFHLGLAYQIQDDILDFTAAASILGKPALADMDLGLSTAPILYAAQEYPNLKPLVMRRFKKDGDKQMALEHLYKSKTAMDKARNLARFHAQRAIDALLRLPQTDSRDALVRLTHLVITRQK
jgi:geranylgeranyl pyrophosphate synthase